MAKKNITTAIIVALVAVALVLLAHYLTEPRVVRGNLAGKQPTVAQVEAPIPKQINDADLKQAKPKGAASELAVVAKFSGASPEVIARVKDLSIPLEQRKLELIDLVNKGGDVSVATLMEIATQDTYLSRFAMEGLGQFKDLTSEQLTRLRAFLVANLKSPDPIMVSSAIRSLARLEGEAAISEIASVLTSNHQRADGQWELVCSAAIEALGQITSTAIVPVLTKELDRSQQPGWSLEYGSRILRVLRQVGNPEAKAAALVYANVLMAQMPKDPAGKKYFEQKITEARELAQGK
jgi:hypothetical protein